VDSAEERQLLLLLGHVEEGAGRGRRTGRYHAHHLFRRCAAQKTLMQRRYSARRSSYQQAVRILRRAVSDTGGLVGFPPLSALCTFALWATLSSVQGKT
jgi:cytochrome b